MTVLESVYLAQLWLVGRVKGSNADFPNSTSKDMALVPNAKRELALASVQRTR